jgi:hypothetical protein
LGAVTLTTRRNGEPSPRVHDNNWMQDKTQRLPHCLLTITIVAYIHASRETLVVAVDPLVNLHPLRQHIMIQLPPVVVLRCSEKAPCLTSYSAKTCSSCTSDTESVFSDSSYMHSEIGNSEAEGDHKAGLKRAPSKSKSRVGAWPRGAMRSLRRWFTMCLGERDAGTASVKDEHRSPLLTKAPIYTPRHAAASFLRTATSRKMRNDNRCL